MNISTEDTIVYDRLDAVDIALDRGLFDRAEALLADVREFNGPSERLFALEGRLAFERGQLDLARRLNERARACNPGAPEHRDALARVHLAAALPDEALSS